MELTDLNFTSLATNWNITTNTLSGTKVYVWTLACSNDLKYMCYTDVSKLIKELYYAPW